MKYLVALLLFASGFALTVSLPEVSGKEVTVPVSIEGASNIGSMDIAVIYNNDALQVVKVEKGALANGIFSASTGTSGVVTIGIASISGISGSGEIARITFRVSRDSELRVTASAYTTEGAEIAVETRDGYVHASSASLPVLPIVIAAGAIGAAGLFIARKGVKK